MRINAINSQAQQKQNVSFKAATIHKSVDKLISKLEKQEVKAFVTEKTRQGVPVFESTIANIRGKYEALLKILKANTEDLPESCVVYVDRLENPNQLRIKDSKLGYSGILINRRTVNSYDDLHIAITGVKPKSVFLLDSVVPPHERMRKRLINKIKENEQITLSDKKEAKKILNYQHEIGDRTTWWTDIALGIERLNAKRKAAAAINNKYIK